MTQLPVHDRCCHVETAGFTLPIPQMAFGDGACVRFDHECYWPIASFALCINCVALGEKRTSPPGESVRRRREVPRKPMVGTWLQMTLRSPLVSVWEARYPGSRTGHKRILSHRWGS